MTWALCLNCGSLKFGAWCPCPDCQVGSTGDSDLDILFSDHNFAEATLRALGEIVQQIRQVCDDDSERFWVFMKYFSDSYPEILTIRLPKELGDRVTGILSSLQLKRVQLERPGWYQKLGDISDKQGQGRPPRPTKRSHGTLLQRVEKAPREKEYTDWPDPLMLHSSHAGSRPIEQCEAAVESARMRGDRVAEAHALVELGHAYFALPDASRAVDCYLEAVAMTRELGDRKAEGEYLGCLGNGLFAQRELEQASQCFEDALGIARETGDPENEAKSLGGLGNAVLATVIDWHIHRVRLRDVPRLFRLSRTVRRAMPFYEQAVDIAREIGDRRGEGCWLGNLGSAYHRLGRMRQAIPYYERALAIAQEVGDQPAEAAWLRSLGNAYRVLRQPEQAMEYQGRALMVEASGMDPGVRAILLYDFGLQAHRAGDFGRAREFWSHALPLSESLGLPLAGTIRRRLADVSD